MPEELTNLLPSARQAAFKRAYYLRLATVAAFIGIVLTVIAAILLLPTYVYVGNAIVSKQARLASVTAELQSSDEANLRARIAALTSNAQALTSLARTPTAITAIQTILGVPRPGITLDSFTYNPSSKDGPRTLELSGISVSRATLRSYQLGLEANPLVKNAALPVSVYAKDSNLPFTLTLTLADTP